MTLIGKSTQVHQKGGRSNATTIAVLLFMRGFAEEEGWLDMANGHVLSRAPQWVQSQYQQ